MILMSDMTKLVLLLFFSYDRLPMPSQSKGYRISSRTRSNAKKMGVTVKPSTRKGKKIDVYKNGKKVASIGAKGYNDYASFIKSKGKSYANRRRSAYKKRHSKDRSRRGTAGYYADKLLW